MRDDELSALLRSPALALDPPPDLVGAVRSRARRVRRRQTAGVAALAVLALGVGGLVLPGLLDAGEEQRERVAESARDRRFPAATTPVVVLSELNGGEVVSFFEGRAWCTAAVRSGTSKACSRALGSDVPPFAFVRTPGNETLTVDRDTLVAGVLGSDVARVGVRLSDDDREYTASSVEARGFLRPVWSMQVPAGSRVEGLTAYDAAGEVVATLDL